ncbi:family 16 glycoside hydrolase [Duganella radicis]|uniref:galactosylceramidase n=1 Tax=Duganella radicis TaxID=551988 RepID=A0A6L6PJW7_9BURK|nr:family 16 glycoside hydrolase [Duganella radicis]MTV39416.1 galactosylceramidase [Duganella radicis]
MRSLNKAKPDLILRGLAVACIALLSNSALAAATPQTVTLDGKAGGKRFDGIGVVDGGGATSVLLKDYPEPLRGQILDLLYKPKFGASVSALMAEIPGDGNATQGSMPSHMHTRDDLDYSRGYTWWVLREAKKRNPRLSLDGAAWSAPGWIGDNLGKAQQDEHRFFSQDTADYYAKWLTGLRKEHGLEFDALGVRNEKGTDYVFPGTLRKTLNAAGFGKVRIHGFDNWPDEWKFNFVRDMTNDPALRDGIDIIGAHINAPESVVPGDVRKLAAEMGKPIWNTEQHVYKAGYEGLISIVQAFNDNFVSSGVTKIVNWYGIAGMYTLEPYNGEKEAAVRANWPWGGHAEINPALWGYAHYGQFSEVGWTYLDGGSGKLAGGGTYVTLMAPSKDYSVIIETKGATAPQQLSFAIGGGLAKGALAVWRTTSEAYFVRQADLKPINGAVTIRLEPNAVYSLTTTRGQTKGTIGGGAKPDAFPFPYYETFEQYDKPQQWGYLPRYFADINGAFELKDCPGQNKGRCLRQSVPVPSISWSPDWQPYTIIGDDKWRDYEVSADVYLGQGESAAVMGRINHVGTGYGFIPKGYFLQLDDGGRLRLTVIRGKENKKALVGDAEQQALIKASNDADEGGEKDLATTRIPDVAAGQWHSLKLRFEGSHLTGFIDGKAVLQADDASYGQGMAGLLAGTDGKRFSMPWYDNVLLNHLDGQTPAPTPMLQGQRPMYAKAPPVR